MALSLPSIAIEKWRMKAKVISSIKNLMALEYSKLNLNESGVLSH